MPANGRAFQLLGLLVGQEIEVGEDGVERRSAEFSKRRLCCPEVALLDGAAEASVRRTLRSHEHMFAFGQSDDIAVLFGPKASEPGYRIPSYADELGAMALVDDFFAPWEQEVTSFDEIHELLSRLYEKWVSAGRTIAWRGMVRADWPLHSSLYRRLNWTSTSPPTEPQLEQEEKKLLALVHQWGLHNGSRGRLSVLEQLATLQHFGAPTRLIDVSMNAYIRLWFAVEEVWRNGERIHEDHDGRLFAIDVSQRLINENDDEREWEDDPHRPWKDLGADEWRGKTRAWRPPPFEARIAAQHGAFLFGGVPQTGTGLVWPKATAPGSGNWLIADVRRCTSIPLRFHKADPEAGGVPAAGGQPAYTFRISSAAKSEIRRRLGELFGYTHRTIYPDYPGFARHAMEHLHTEAPRA